MLQLREMPTRPKMYDGVLCLFKLTKGVDKVAVHMALQAFGEVVKVDVEIGRLPAAIVHFATHEAAVRTKEAAGQLTHIADGIDTFYNERPYDNRGWCCFEGSVSSELLSRLNAYPRLQDALATLPPKRRSACSSPQMMSPRRRRRCRSAA